MVGALGREALCIDQEGRHIEVKYIYRLRNNDLDDIESRKSASYIKTKFLYYKRNNPCTVLCDVHIQRQRSEVHRYFRPAI